MAAVRRGSESVVVVALVISVVLAFVGIGCGIWFYQQLSIAKKAIRANQAAFANSVESVFREANWQLSVQTADELEVRTTQTTYSDVAAKLKSAAEYENVVLPLLGWKSLKGMQDAIDGSPAQLGADERGQPRYTTMLGLMDFYEAQYSALSQEVADLRGKNASLTLLNDGLKGQLTDAEKQKQQELNDAAAKYKADLDQKNADHNALKAQYEEQRQVAVDWQQKYQQEVNERRQEVALLEARARVWEKRYQDLITPPGEGEKLVADGKIISVDVANDFVMIQGGQDREVRENDRFVVYEVTPAGTGMKKGVLRVGQVLDHTSYATIAEEDEYIIEGDEFMSLARWTEMERKALARGSS